MALDSQLTWFARRIEDYLYRQPALMAVVDDRSAEFQGMTGDRLTMNYMNTAQSQAVRSVTNGTPLSYDVMNDAQANLDLDQHKYTANILYDSEARTAQNGMQAMARIAQTQARALNDDINKFLYDELSATSIFTAARRNRTIVDSATTFDISALSGGAVLTATQRAAYMNALFQALTEMEEQGWFDYGRPPVFITSVYVKRNIIDAYFRVDKPNYGAGGLPDTAYLNARGVQVIGGIPIMTDKNVPSIASTDTAQTDGTGLPGYFVIAGDTIKFGQVLRQPEMLRSEQHLGELLRTQVIYGATLPVVSVGNADAQPSQKVHRVGVVTVA